MNINIKYQSNGPVNCKLDTASYALKTRLATLVPLLQTHSKAQHGGVHRRVAAP